jgi:hypothetical protein
MGTTVEPCKAKELPHFSSWNNLMFFFNFAKKLWKPVFRSLQQSTRCSADRKAPPDQFSLQREVELTWYGNGAPERCSTVVLPPLWRKYLFVKFISCAVKGT